MESVFLGDGQIRQAFSFYGVIIPINSQTTLA